MRAAARFVFFWLLAAGGFNGGSFITSYHKDESFGRA